MKRREFLVGTAFAGAATAAGRVMGASNCGCSANAAKCGCAKNGKIRLCLQWGSIPVADDFNAKLDYL